MAQRRMFDKAIVESDAFLDMPCEAQALYFHLNMYADDDGIVDGPRKVMRTIGAKDDSMLVLISKKFVLTYEKGVDKLICIKHWRVNNYIRKDTYHETKYKEFMRELFLDENQSYSQNPGDGHVPAIGNIRDEPVTDTSRTRDEIPTHNASTQVRLGKDSIDKDSLVQSKTREGESEGEPPPAPPADLDPEKQKRWKYFHEMLDFYRNAGFNSRLGEVYAQALKEGIKL